MQPVRGIVQCLIQRRAAPIKLRAIVQHLTEAEGRQRFVGERWAQGVVFWPIAAGLHNQHGAVRLREVANIGTPIVQAMVAEHGSIGVLFPRALGLWRPDQ